MTPKERENRFKALHEMGCCICSLFFNCYTEPCIHHLTGLKYRGMGRRADDSATIPLCVRHHMYGTVENPAIHSHPKLFEEMYGSQESLLEEVNRRLTGGVEDNN